MLIIGYIYVSTYITYKIQKESNLESRIVYSFPKIHMIKLCICFSLAPLRLKHFNPVRVQLYFVIFFSNCTQVYTSYEQEQDLEHTTTWYIMKL